VISERLVLGGYLLMHPQKTSMLLLLLLLKLLKDQLLLLPAVAVAFWQKTGR
jgi:hypothetical protein